MSLRPRHSKAVLAAAILMEAAIEEKMLAGIAKSDSAIKFFQ